jgi:hypothetical protein
LRIISEEKRILDWVQSHSCSSVWVRAAESKFKKPGDIFIEIMK